MKYSSNNHKYRNPPPCSSPGKALDKAAAEALAVKIRQLAAKHPGKAARILTAWLKK